MTIYALCISHITQKITIKNIIIQDILISEAALHRFIHTHTHTNTHTHTHKYTHTHIHKHTHTHTNRASIFGSCLMNSKYFADILNSSGR